LIEIINLEKIIEFTKKLTEIFIIKEKIELNESQSFSVVINKSKSHNKKFYSTFKGFDKSKKLKLFHKFSLFMNLIKLDVFYDNPTFFNFLMGLLEIYYFDQEICYEEIIFNLNLFEIVLSNIEKRFLTENFLSKILEILNKIINFFKVTIINQEKLMKICDVLISSIPFDDLKYFSIYEAINNLNDHEILFEFISPSISSKNFFTRIKLMNFFILF